MSKIRVVAAGLEFEAALETEAAPKTCKVFLDLLPYRERIIHVRWSGEGCWIPLGDTDFGLGFENATRYPAPGQFILYPGGYSETELVLAYGSVSFASKLGGLAGNHFLTITKGQEALPQLGKKVLWEGAQDILFEQI